MTRTGTVKGKLVEAKDSKDSKDSEDSKKEMFSFSIRGNSLIDTGVYTFRHIYVKFLSLRPAGEKRIKVRRGMLDLSS